MTTALHIISFCCPWFFDGPISDWLEVSIQGYGGEKPLSGLAGKSVWTHFWESDHSERTQVTEEVLQFYECLLQCGQYLRLMGRLTISLNTICFVSPSGNTSLVAHLGAIRAFNLLDESGNKVLCGRHDVDSYVRGDTLLIVFLDGRAWRLWNLSDACGAYNFLKAVWRLRERTYGKFLEPPGLWHWMTQSFRMLCTRSVEAMECKTDPAANA